MRFWVLDFIFSIFVPYESLDAMLHYLITSLLRLIQPQQHRCQTYSDIRVRHRGRCRNECGPECYSVYEPVCGTDELTYMSRCDLERTACLKMDETLQVAYNQECVGVAQQKGRFSQSHFPRNECGTPCCSIHEPLITVILYILRHSDDHVSVTKCCSFGCL